MKFICFNGSTFTSDHSEIEIITPVFIYLKKDNVLVNYRTTSHDYDFNCQLSGNNIGQYLITNNLVIPDTTQLELGLNFAGFKAITSGTNFEQLKIGMEEIERLVPINKNNFLGKFLTNLNPSISMGKTTNITPTLVGSATTLSPSFLTGDFSFSNGKVKYVRYDWLDYIKL